MTTEKDGEATKTGEPNKMLIFVTVKTGDTKEHIIDVPSSYKEGLETIILFLEEISAALEGKRASLWVINPPAVYNASQIVFIELDFVTPKEWKEMINKAIRHPLGFKPQKEGTK